MATNGGAGGLSRLGAWAARRTEPRLWVTLAGAGCLLAVFGLLLVSGDAQIDDDGSAGSNAPGIVLFLLVVAAGYLLMHFFREAPAASAGVAAVVLGTPPLIWFLTFDAHDVPPVSFEAVLGLSAAAWLVSYVVGPGRGRPLLLGAGLIFAWLFALQVIEDPFASDLDSPPVVIDDPFDEEFEDDFGGGFDDEDFDEDFDGGFGGDGFSRSGDDPWTTLGTTTVLFGGGYLATARLLDRRRWFGTATPFVVAGHVALPTGLAMLGDDLEVGGTGAAFVIAGALICWMGALGNRRATTIIGALEVVLGLSLLVEDAMSDSTPTSVGFVLFALGAVIAAGSQLLHVATGEPPQTTPGPSSFPGRRPPGGAPAYAAGPYAPGPYAPGPQPGAVPPGGAGWPGAGQPGSYPPAPHPPGGGPVPGSGPGFDPPPPPPPPGGGSSF